MKTICTSVLVLAAVPLVFLLAVDVAPCEASCVNRQAWCATATVPFALDTPLRGYRVPRRVVYDAWPRYTVGQDGPFGCWGGAAPSAGARFAPDTSDGFELFDFQVLGQIPNDLLLDPDAAR